MSSGSDSTVSTAPAGNPAAAPGETGDPVSSDPPAGSAVMSAFLDSVRVTVRDEMRRHVPSPSAPETNLHPTGGSVGTDPGAGVPPSAATTVAGPSGAGAGEYSSWAGTHATKYHRSVAGVRMRRKAYIYICMYGSIRK